MRPPVPIGLGCASSVANHQTVSCRYSDFPHFSVVSMAAFPCSRDYLLPAGMQLVRSARGSERAPLNLSIDFRAAVPEDFAGVPHRLSVRIIEICGRQAKQWAEF